MNNNSSQNQSNPSGMDQAKPIVAPTTQPLPAQHQSQVPPVATPAVKA